MKFSCYGCGMLFHNGPPPLEALSAPQAWLMEPSMERDLKIRSLDGTRFEGLSSAGICEFCLLWVHEFPSVTKEKYPFAKYSSSFWDDPTYDHNVMVNRMMVLDEACDLYPKHELLPLLGGLLTRGAERISTPCAFPGCEVEAQFCVPAAVLPERCCADHQYSVPITPQMTQEYLSAFKGHDFRVCQGAWARRNDGTGFFPTCPSCSDLWFDWEDQQREAHYEM